MKDIKLYTVTHKDCSLINNDWIQPICVGDYKNSNYLNDSMGKNISSINKNFNEITAQYYVRHNKPSQYVGFLHYRRAMLFDRISLPNTPEVSLSFDEANGLISSLSNRLSLESLLEVYDVICPRPLYFHNGLLNHYKECNIPVETWNLFAIKVGQYYPQGYKYINHLKFLNQAYMRNMYIMPWEIFVDYIDNLMNVIHSVYEELGSNKYETFQQNRYPGLLAEHFLNLYLMTNAVRVGHALNININNL